MWKVYFQECIEHMSGTTKKWSYTQLHLLLNQYKLIDIAIKVDLQKSSVKLKYKIILQDEPSLLIWILRAFSVIWQKQKRPGFGKV